MSWKTWLSWSTAVLDPELDQAERRAVVEQDHEDDPAGDVGQVHRLLLALVEEAAELRLADHPGQLVVGAEVGGGERGKGGGVELRGLAHDRDHLPGAVHDQAAARVGLAQELAQDRVDPVRIFLVE